MTGPGRVAAACAATRRPLPTWAWAVALVGLAGAAAAQEAGEQDRTRRWAEEKCARYASAWEQSLDRRGADGLRPAFLDRHAAFVASGCRARADVCPETAEELALANAMIVFSMNAGAASTFAPFACRD